MGPMRKRFRLLGALGAAAALFAGCGGSANRQAADVGSASFVVNWPERSRVIPTASNSIKFEITRAGAPVATRIVDRPADGGQCTASSDRPPPAERPPAGP